MLARPEVACQCLGRRDPERLSARPSELEQAAETFRDPQVAEKSGHLLISIRGCVFVLRVNDGHGGSGHWHICTVKECQDSDEGRCRKVDREQT